MLNYQRVYKLYVHTIWLVPQGTCRILVKFLQQWIVINQARSILRLTFSSCFHLGCAFFRILEIYGNLLSKSTEPFARQ